MPRIDMQQRYKRDLGFWKEQTNRGYDVLMVAICYTQLGEYTRAKLHYGRALEDFLRDRRGWHGISMPELLVHTYILAGQPDVYSQVSAEIEAYKLDYRGTSPAAFYAYAVLYLIAGKDQEAANCVPGIQKRPKQWKETYAQGKTIRALVERDQTAFDQALQELLLVHRGIAKFGELRESPEGFLSLSAISLSKMGLDRGMAINAESEYLSKGYLTYLLERPQ
jgi:tetratricopeptide (TPR) repeat protein